MIISAIRDELLIMFIERFFRKYLCPLGAIFAITSRLGITKINKPKADCGQYRACANNCSISLV